METINLSRQPNGDLAVVPLAVGWCQVWERPRPGCRYLLSVRPGGKPKLIGGRMDRERSVVMVLRAGYLEEGAERWHPTRLAARLAPPALLDPTPLAQLVAMLAGWYGDALCFVEVKDGATTAKECQRMGAGVQVREVLDKATGEFSQKIGWDSEENDGEAAAAALNALVNAIRESGSEQAGERRGGLTVECRHCLAELETFGGVESAAPAVSHDDDVRALATGIYNIESASKLPVEMRARQAPQDGWRVMEGGRW